MQHNIRIYGDIELYGQGIDGVTSVVDVNNALAELNVSAGDDLIVGVHTLGGSVDAGFSINNNLRRFAKENQLNLVTRLDGVCASIGVVILLAGDKRIGNSFASPFVHNAWSVAMGDSKEFEKCAKELEDVSNRIAEYYAQRIDITFEKAKELMDNDTSIEPKDALKYGFFTEIEEYIQAINSLAIFKEIQERNQSIKNFKQNNMSKENSLLAQIKNLLLGEQKNAIVYTAENKELLFAELNEGEMPQVGDKATLDGKNVTGEILTQNGSKFNFDNGVLQSITEVQNSATDELKAIKDENEALKNSLLLLTEKLTGIEAKLTERESVHNSLKALVSGIQEPQKQEFNASNQASTEPTLEEKIKEFKFKRLK